MATYTANIATTQTLSADTVDTVTLTSPATRVTVTCSSAVGSGTVYFTVGSGSATTPTVGGSNAYAVVAGSSFTVDFDGSFPTVKLISSAALTYTVAAASVFNKLADNTVDNATLQIASGIVSVKDGGITAAKMADDSITTAKIADSSVTTAKINDGSITAAKMATDNIPGLVYITQASFTSSAAVNVDNCFTSTYSNYKLMIRITGVSADTGIFLRMRTGGVTNASANYVYGGLISYSGSGILTAVFSGAPTTDWALGTQDTNYYPNLPQQIEVMHPQLSLRTGIFSQAFQPVNNQPYYRTIGGTMSVTTSYDGFSLITNSGSITMSGLIRVYGYN